MTKRLQAFEQPARARADQGEFWWELRACAYYDEFEKPLVMYQEICTYQSFGWSNGGLYGNNKIFILPEAKPYLLGILNAQTTWFYLNQVASKLQGGALAMQSPYVKSIPIPTATDAQRAEIETLVEQILTAKAADSGADTSALEAEIDRLVFSLYELTAEEIALVTGA